MHRCFCLETSGSARLLGCLLRKGDGSVLFKELQGGKEHRATKGGTPGTGRPSLIKRHSRREYACTTIHNLLRKASDVCRVLLALLPLPLRLREDKLQTTAGAECARRGVRVVAIFSETDPAVGQLVWRR